MSRKKCVVLATALLAGVAMAAQTAEHASVPLTSVAGYLRDAGCAYRFREVVKPLPNGCLKACVRAGSPLVIVTEQGRIYPLISDEIPDEDVRPRLLPYAGKLVKVTGHVYERGGAKALTVERIDAMDR